MLGPIHLFVTGKKHGKIGSSTYDEPSKFESISPVSFLSAFLPCIKILKESVNKIL
jgi:hypothetical protein